MKGYGKKSKEKKPAIVIMIEAPKKKKPKGKK
jgi:hypothetical protein